MSSLLHTFLPTRPLPDALPVSHTHQTTLRRRLSSLPLPTSLQNSKSISPISVRRWWDWGGAWILSIFASDLKLNEHESKLLGTWRHVFFKFRSQIRKLINSDVGLPRTNRN